MAAFFVTFFIIFYNVLEMSAPYTDKYSKTVLQTAFFYSPVLPKLPVDEGQTGGFCGMRYGCRT